MQEPDLALLRVDIGHAEAWDADTRIWNRVKNKTTGYRVPQRLRTNRYLEIAGTTALYLGLT